ncbi:MAG: hypothetical protein EP319_05330 [Deltaproteobacteria bacterium]|nr:MAG: hypothetical protein EP319_05330 [Deltaproteobacteria bacterium]
MSKGCCTRTPWTEVRRSITVFTICLRWATKTKNFFGGWPYKMSDQNNIKIFIYPTDTVWGIGTNATLEGGSDAIAGIKKTGKGKPLSVLFPNLSLLNEYFDFPGNLDQRWLADFFNAESTLGLPVSWSKGKIAPSVYAGMPHICVRCIESPEVSKLVEVAGGPVLTTSVNVTGNPPASNRDEAWSFFKEHVSDGQFIELEKLRPSGHSSTMVLLNEDLTWTMIREGEKVDDVRQKLELLPA